MSESARGEGGRVWVPKTPGDKRDPKSIPENERWYFLEEWYPKYGNLVPRDIATRAIHKVVYEHNLGIDGKPMVYLDLTHIDRKMLDRKLEGILEIYEKFVGDDPRDTPMKIFPGMHYTMGGLWVDFNAGHEHPRHLRRRRVRVSVPRRQPPGREFAGLLHLRRLHRRARPPCNYARNLKAAPSNGYFEAERKRQEENNASLMKSDGTENPFKLWRELGELMTKNCTVIRYNKNLQETDAKLVELLERFRHINLSDRTQWANTTVVFARQLYNMLQLARVIAQGAAHARRIARRALQAGLPRARRQELAEDDESNLRPGRRRAEIRIRAGGRFVDSAAAEEVRRSEVSTRSRTGGCPHPSVEQSSRGLKLKAKPG